MIIEMQSASLHWSMQNNEWMDMVSFCYGCWTDPGKAVASPSVPYLCPHLLPEIAIAPVKTERSF